MIKDPFARLGLDREVLTVSQLNGRARVLLEDVFSNIWVEGEISNLARPASGHVYFTLKDSGAQVRCALFRQNAARVRQALKDGLAVKVRGKVSLFEGRGDYQLILDTVEPAGDGALRLAFDALKEKLSAEGLFSAERKVPLPAHPQRIGIISSPTGAVIRDIISVFRRRAPQVQLTLIPTAVQGREATAQIVRALKLADARGFDALILARGGGSLEDLWAFNSPQLVRQIARAPMPVVSGVGHETDFTLADFVADLRAPTPTAAAELCAPSRDALLRDLSVLQDTLGQAVWRSWDTKAQRLDRVAQRLGRPSGRVAQERSRLQSQAHRMARAVALRLDRERGAVQNMAQRWPVSLVRDARRQRQQLDHLAQRLSLLDPTLVLQRGYAWLADEHGHAVTSVTQTHVGQALRGVLADGEVGLTVNPAKP